LGPGGVAPLDDVTPGRAKAVTEAEEGWVSEGHGQGHLSRRGGGIGHSAALVHDGLRRAGARFRFGRRHPSGEVQARGKRRLLR
jgi:hypothetical protein